MKLSLRSWTVLDLRDAYVWYAGRGLGLGERFLRSVDACFELLCREPEIYPSPHELDDRLRCAPLHRFPHMAHYVIRDDRVDVLAVYHGRRPPRFFDPYATLA